MTDVAAATSSDLGPGAGLRCPLCEYDLRGLVEPRCPECGYAFDWAELREAVRLHPYLFEHHPQRNVSSFWRTLRRGWRAKHFWETLRPTHRPRPVRLAIYAFLVTLPAWLLPASLLVTLLAQKKPWPIIRNALWSLADYRQPRQLALVTLLLVLWPWLTLATLTIFQATMRRAAVRKVHVVRCAVYACDVTFWGGLVVFLTILNAALWHGERWMFTWDEHVLAAMRWVTFGLPVVVTWRLAHACWLYLRIPHATAVALATQLILVLLATKFAFDYDLLHWPR